MNDILEKDNELSDVQEVTEENIFILEEIPEDGYDVTGARKVIEAVLFAAGHPVTYSKLSQVLETTPGVVKRVVREEIIKCEENHITDWLTIKTNLKDTLRDYVFQKTKRNPMILPIIMEV